MKIGDPRHEFMIVERGQRTERIMLRSSITIDGQIYSTQQAFPFGENEVIMQVLDACEEQLARAVGRKIVKGMDL